VSSFFSARLKKNHQEQTRAAGCGKRTNHISSHRPFDFTPYFPIYILPFQGAAIRLVDTQPKAMPLGWGMLDFQSATL
jgi:hypothetical protein